jgi:hypothetical protein
MKKNTPIVAVLVAVLTITFFACKKSNGDTNFISYKSYVSPQKGKYIVYRLDSTVTKDFGVGFVTRSYTIKDSVANVFKDNTGRESFTIYRLQLNPNNTWAPINTFVITPQDNSLEYVENNQRYVLLANPVSELKTWRGNNDIAFSPYYKTSSISSWDFFYTDIQQPKTIGALTFNNTITVVQNDSMDNKPFSPVDYNSYEKGYEIYADSLGLIYRDIMVWEYQQKTRYDNCKLIKPKTGGGFDTLFIDCNNGNTKCDSLKLLPDYKVLCDISLTGFAYDGFGIRQTILSHN